MKKLHLFLWLCLIYAISSASTVTNLSGFYRHGQVFLTWKCIPGSNAYYKVYRSAAPIVDSNQLTSCEYLGNTDKTSAQDHNLSAHDNITEYLRLDSAGTPLAPGTGLFVATTLVNGNYYYAVTSIFNGSESLILIAGSNVLTSFIAETVDIPRPVFQVERLATDQIIDVYTTFFSTKKAIGQPLEIKAGYLALDFAVNRNHSTGNQPLHVILHGGGGDFFDNMAVILSNEINIGLEERLPSGENNGWWGNNENYDIFQNNTTNGKALAGMDYNYEQQIITQTINWALSHLPVDSNRIYLDGVSMGAGGAFMYMIAYPERIAAVSIRVPCFNYGFMNDYQPTCSLNPGMKNRNDGDAQFGPVSTNPMSNLGLHMYDATNGGWMIHTYRKKDYPVIFTTSGKHDLLVGWTEKPIYYDSVKANHVGGYYFWDESDHGGDNGTWTNSNFNLFRYRRNASFPAFANCSNDEDYGIGNDKTGADYGSVNGSLDWNDSILDNPQTWQVKIFVRDLKTVTGALVVYPYSCTVDITPRRLQQFHVPVGASVNWTVSHNKQIIQSGTLLYTGDIIVIPQVRAFRDTATLHLSYQTNSRIYYRDNDHDGYGNATDSIVADSQLVGYVPNNTDCNDSDASVHPLAVEICNAIDDNCNGQTDENVTNTFYADDDADGYGNNSEPIESCNILSGYVANNLDCDDNNSFVHPDVVESCNSIDDNCNGQIDEGVQSIFYADADGDGYGNPNSSTSSCSAPNGYVINNNDCNDANASVYPNATEVCNRIDDNCNGQIDEGVQLVFYSDSDHDGFGDASNSILSCNAPPGNTSDHTDCNDANPSIHPGAIEICNGIDDNCNGVIDESTLHIFYYDNDQDGFGNPDSFIMMFNCDVPLHYVENNLDCNDNNPMINPGAIEVCNLIDDNCNGQIDEGVQTIFYSDLDGDGYGNNNFYTLACSAPTGSVTNSTDCNDANPLIHPGAIETCNNLDDNCNGQIDENLISSSISANGSTAFCDGGSVILNATPTGTGITYQWKLNNINILNATSSTYTASGSGNYSVTVSIGICSSTSSIISVTNYGKPPVTIAPAGSVNLCQSSTLVLTASGNNAATYQWKNGKGKNISGATASTLSITKGDSYSVFVTDTHGCSNTSAPTIVTQVPKPNVTVTPLGSLNICTTHQVTLSAPSNMTSYSWYKESKAIHGATKQTYVATVTGAYKVKVFDANGCSNISAVVTITSTCKEADDIAPAADQHLSIYPNPTNGIFVIDLLLDDPSDQNTTIEINNLLGQTIYAEKITIMAGKLSQEIHMPKEVTSGIYFVKVTTGKKVLVERISYQK